MRRYGSLLTKIPLRESSYRSRSLLFHTVLCSKYEYTIMHTISTATSRRVEQQRKRLLSIYNMVLNLALLAFSLIIKEPREEIANAQTNFIKKTGVINDPLGQIHGLASSHHIIWKLFCFFAILKSEDGCTDWQHVWKQLSLPSVIVGRPNGSNNKYCYKKFGCRHRPVKLIKLIVHSI